ncbi:MAG: GFA family protein [Pseudomonadota bacterium]
MLTGRCYCGATHIQSAAGPLTVAYCHCADCRRWTGAPVAAFAAVPAEDFTLDPDPGAHSATPGVDRWNCAKCGSPLAARFDYLPEQIYIPIGVIDQAADLPPALHSHADNCLPWLNLQDNLPRHSATARPALLSGE